MPTFLNKTTVRTAVSGAKFYLTDIDTRSSKLIKLNLNQKGIATEIVNFPKHIERYAVSRSIPACNATKCVHAVNAFVAEGEHQSIHNRIYIFDDN